MLALPLDICKIIEQYKVSMELLEDRPKPQHYVSKYLAEERQILTQICALSFGNLSTILRARDILEASVDLIDFYDAAPNSQTGTFLSRSGIIERLYELKADIVESKI